MRYATERLRALEKEYEDLEWRLECSEGETKFFEDQLDMANKALVEMWWHVPRDKRALLIDTNEYIGEMFWDER